jgi:4-hydroxybenzoate polyprenyltransferase
VSGRLALTLRMIRFEHSVFALPFALAGAWLAAAGAPAAADLVMLVIAAVAARAAAMAFNRLVDRRLDAANPRTAARELPAGRLGPRFVGIFTLACAGVFVAASFRLATPCGWLAFPVLALLFGYSLLKRFTWACHLGLGLALACAPAGAWLAVAKDFQPGWSLPLAVGLGVVAWVAGFDLLYALQDEEHDRSARLHSFPARFGTRATLRAAAALFLLACAAWAAVGWGARLGAAYWAGCTAIAALLLAELALVRRSGVRGVPAAFFTVNAWVGPVYFAGLWLGLPEHAAAPLVWAPR